MLFNYYLPFGRGEGKNIYNLWVIQRTLTYFVRGSITVQMFDWFGLGRTSKSVVD